ncbi:hypothetical protein AAGS40_24480 [Paraburkholderia sp. PREW-6R]|uniref:hypothetical protein n=1 Tax=Paraburkholderia sp. PREW-6R TaxID=3141544 RepID=UPI0031F54B91
MHLKDGSAWLLCMAALASTAAQASDIQCSTTQQPAERVICDHAILNNEYDDIFAQQQTLLSAGKVSPQQIALWRQSRNVCTDVHCIDTLFAQWKATAKAIQTSAATAQAPALVPPTALAPVGPTSDAYPGDSTANALAASEATPISEASLVRQGSAAGVALPQPVASQASSPGAASAATGASESHAGTAGFNSVVAPVVLIAIALGAFLYRRSRRS